jgi:hypothetical protein
MADLRASTSIWPVIMIMLSNEWSIGPWRFPIDVCPQVKNACHDTDIKRETESHLAQ